MKSLEPCWIMFDLIFDKEEERGWHSPSVLGARGPEFDSRISHPHILVSTSFRSV